jgi:hypothetical protein
MVVPHRCLNVALGGEPQDQGVGDDILLLAWFHAADEPVGNRVPQAVGHVSRQADCNSNRLHAALALPVVALDFAPLGGARWPRRSGFPGKTSRITVHRQTSRKSSLFVGGQPGRPQPTYHVGQDTNPSAGLQAYNL